MDRKEFYSKLSDEVKAKIKACQTEEEMLQVLKEEKIELDPELLDQVSGGYIPPYACPEECCADGKPIFCD